MRRSLILPALALLALSLPALAGPAAATSAHASAQAWLPAQTYVGDPLADRLRDRVEIQRLQSAEQADFARQQALSARLTELEIRAARQPEPYIPRVAVPATPDERRRAREAATARRQAVAAEVSQIDDWLARDPR